MTVRRLLAAGTLLALCLAAPTFAEDTKSDKDNPAAKPENRDVPRHKQFLEKVAKGEGDVIFLGDSITQGWEGAGKEAWAKTFAPMKAVNLGIGGDKTGHVLWRITEGKEIAPLKPKLAVIMIGTNNTGRDTAEQIAGGIKAIVAELRKQKPEMKILLLGVFPRSGPGADRAAQLTPADKLQPKIKQINDIIAKMDDGKMVFYKDIGPKFLEPDGSLDKKVMPDFLHLSPKGYEIWADAIKDDVQKLAK
jgi:lysophospholipase L1-like esterase